MVSPLVKRFQVSCAQNKLLGFAAGFFVLIVSGVVAIIPPKPPPPQEYKAVGILAYSSPPPTVTETGQALFEQGKLTIADERALINEQVILPVVEAFERKNVKKFIKSIEVKFPKKPEDPQVIQVNYTDTKEKRSANILQMLLEGMVEESRRMNTLQLQAQIEALTQRLQGAKRELTVAEQAFYRFMSQEASGLAPVQDGSLFSAISQAQQQQRELRFQLEGINSQMASITGQLKLTPEQAALASALSADPIIASLRAQILQVEKELTLSEQTLRPEHPKMVELKQQLTSLDQLQNARAAEVIGTDGVFTAEPRQVRQDSSLDATRQQLANRLVELQTQQQALTKQLAIAQQTERQLRQDYERFPTKQLEQERLQQELTLKKNFHDFLQAKLVDARTAEAETVGSLIVAQPPQIQEVESTYSPPPPPPVIIAVGVVGSVVVGLVVIFGLGMLDPHLYTTSEIQALLSDRDITLLGKLPVFQLNATQTLPLLLGRNRTWLPQYELFRSNLRRWSGHKAKVVLITSVDAEEGKSTTAYNLAIAAAQAGQRTLLIEADLRSPTHAASIGVQIDSDAQSEPLGYYSSFAASTALVPGVANLYVIPSAGPQINAPVILESSELRRLVANARPRFDMVIVDTPALAECNDALLLQPLGDGLVIVMQPGITNGKIAGSLLDQLIEAELPILGGVVNGAEEVTADELFAELPDEPERPTFNGAMKNGDRTLPNTPSPQPSNPLPPRLRSR